MQKKLKVVLLQTDKKHTAIWSYKGRRLYFNQANFNDEDETQYFEMYILSDDEIKERDWSIVTDLRYFNHNVPFKVQGEKGNPNFNVNRCKGESAKKIIATTNPELELPRPSNSFLQKYVEEYNKGNVITEVIVEYKKELYLEEQNSGLFSTEDVLCSRTIPIVTSNNTLIIRPVEETWHTVLENIFARNKNLRETESPEDFLETVANILSKEYNPPTKKK